MRYDPATGRNIPVDDFESSPDVTNPSLQPPTSKDRTSKRLSSAQSKANAKRMTAVGMDQMKPAADRFNNDGRPHSPAPFSQYAQPNGDAQREELAIEEAEKKSGMCCGGCVIM